MNAKTNSNRETKTPYKDVFARGDSTRVRIFKTKYTIPIAPTADALLRAKSTIIQIISMVEDNVLAVASITSNFVNILFRYGYVSHNLIEQRELVNIQASTSIISEEHNNFKTKTFLECFKDKATEYRNQETVIPNQKYQLKYGSISTYENYISRLTYFNNIEVHQLSIQDVEVFIRMHIKSKNTYKYVYELLRPARDIMEQYVEIKEINENVFTNKYIEMLMSKNLRHSVKYAELLTDDEVLLIIAAENSPIKFIVLTALFTGLRIGEALMVTWSLEDVNLDENRITVNKQFSSKIETTAKTITSNRNIPIVMKPQYKNYIDNFPENVLLDILHDFDNKPKMCEYLFYDPTTKERWRNSDAVNYRMRQFFHGLGIYRHITFHDLRHWFTAYAYEKVGLILTSKYLGHSTTKETLDDYMKIKPDAKLDFNKARKYLVFKAAAPKQPHKK